MTHNGYIKNPHLAGDDFYWEGNPTGILLIHGFTATTAEIRPLAEKLHQAGYTTAGPLLPGHGTHPDDLNRTTRQMWIEKVKQVYEKLTVNCQRVFIAGASLGGILTLELARQHPEAAGLCLFAPAIKVDRLWQSHFLHYFIQYIHKNGKDDGLAWKGYTVYPVKAITEFHKLQRQVQRGLSSINQPVLLFTSEYDHWISKETVEIILEGINSNVKHHIHLLESGHCLTLDRELDQVAEHVLAFIERGVKE